MTLDLTPAPGGAPAGARVLAHARTEFSQLARNGEQLLLALVIPIGILLAGHVAADRVGLDPVLFPPSVFALALFSTAFTSLAIMTAFERRYGVLERLAATPLGKRGLIQGKSLAMSSICVAQLAVLTVVALLLGWRPAFHPLALLVAIACAVLACVTFVNLGLALAGSLRAEAVLALANTIYVVLAAAGAVLLPVASYPAAVQPLLRLLPTAALGEAFRAAAVGTVAWWPPLVLAVWAAGTTILARKVFRWMS